MTKFATSRRRRDGSKYVHPVSDPSTVRDWASKEPEADDDPKWLVIENTPGYMPESEPAEFDTLEDAQNYAKELADQLRDDDYHVSGNKHDGYYGERNSRDLGRVIEITMAKPPVGLTHAKINEANREYARNQKSR